jgi:uncharacterized protein (DUF58 family)
VAAQSQARGLRRWSAFDPLSAYLERRVARWIRRRQGEDQLPVILQRRRLYILPTRAGVAFGALLLLMLLAGLNYANSLALFLTFLLAAFALVVMQQCHRNLLGVQVVSVSAPAVFAAGPGALHVTLANGSRLARPHLEGCLPGEPYVVVDLPAHGRQLLTLPLPALRRGIVRVERLRLATSHPCGLFRAWTWVHTPIQMWVYPRPQGSLPMPLQGGQKPGKHPRPESGAEEWAGLRPFRHGDSPRSVDWKAYAREGALLVKQYGHESSELRLFDFGQLRIADTEARLSQLARWVVDAEAHEERYGLILPAARLPPARGPEHRHRCLVALASFGGRGLR